MSINNNRIDESVPQMVDVDKYLALLEEQCNNRYDAYRIILEKQKEKTIGDSIRKGKRVVEGIRTQIRNASRELTETPSYRLLRRNTLVKNIRTLRASLRNAEKEQGLENRIIESRITRATLNSLQTYRESLELYFKDCKNSLGTHKSVPQEKLDRDIRYIPEIPNRDIL